MFDRAEFVVVGGGVMGTTIALSLAEAGVGRVSLVEKRHLGAGSSGKSGAILRQHYSHPVTIGMARDSLRWYAALDARHVGGIDFRRTGLIVVASAADREALARNVELQRSLGVEVRLLDAVGLRTMDPDLVVSESEVGAFERDAACVDPMATLQALESEARRAGVEFVLGRRVISLDRDDGAMRGVRLDGGESIASKNVVIAAGPWSAPLLEAVGWSLPLEVVSPAQAWLGRSAVRRHSAPLMLDVAGGFYCRPEGPGWTRIGELSYDADPKVTDPDHYDEGVDSAFLSRLKAGLEVRIPSVATAPSLGGCHALYTVTPDAQAIIDRCPRLEGLFVATGFSGHGFKLAPSVAELVTAQVLGRPANGERAAFFAAARFDAPRPGSNAYRFGVLG